MPRPQWQPTAYPGPGDKRGSCSHSDPRWTVGRGHTKRSTVREEAPHERGRTDDWSETTGPVVDKENLLLDPHREAAVERSTSTSSPGTPKEMEPEEGCCSGSEDGWNERRRIRSWVVVLRVASRGMVCLVRDPALGWAPRRLATLYATLVHCPWGAKRERRIHLTEGAR